MTKPSRSPSLLFVVCIVLAGCQPAATATPDITPSAPASLEATVTAPAPAQPTATETPAAYWIDPLLPDEFARALKIPSDYHQTADPAEARWGIGPLTRERTADAGTNWTRVYVAATDFYQLDEETTSAALEAAWRDGSLACSPAAGAALAALWGERAAPCEEAARLTARLDRATPVLAVLAFDELTPRWKALRVDGVSVFDADFDAAAYALAAHYGVYALAENADAGTIDAAAWTAGIEPTNLSPDLLARVAVTGVTALVRRTAAAMAEKGVLYPGEQVRDALRSADLTHISNEVSFSMDCPEDNPQRRDMRFCNRPEVMDLLKDIGTDVVELTGNHIKDWGPDPLLYSIQAYRNEGWQIYGGGVNLAEALQPAEVAVKGTRLVFMGCSPAGPESVWATEYQPGSTPCDFTAMQAAIRQYRARGVLPIVTLQAVESESIQPYPAQATGNFDALASAGAVIVSGSQAHIPQGMRFVDGGFVHYGLGNLFFDQVQPPESREGFIDRHIFYNGKHVSTELLTYVIEDYAQPRWMTPDERRAFLTEIFGAVW